MATDHGNSVFNPRILDASIRDVSSFLSDNQKADLLLYAARSLQGRTCSNKFTSAIIENAILSVLQVPTISSGTAAKAYIMRARMRMERGSHLSAREDLQAALKVEPDNPEAKALLHKRSVGVEKLLSPLPQAVILPPWQRLSPELWSTIAQYMSKPDLHSLLFIGPHHLSHFARRLIFRRVCLHFCELVDSDRPDSSNGNNVRILRPPVQSAEHSAIHRSTDILSRIMVDSSFAGGIRSLLINVDNPRDRTEGDIVFEGSGPENVNFTFQAALLANALPKLTHLRSFTMIGPEEAIMSVTQTLRTSHPRLRSLALHCRGSPDLSNVDFDHLQFLDLDFHANGQRTTALGKTTHHTILGRSRMSLRKVILRDLHWNLSAHYPLISIQNLTRLDLLLTLEGNSNQDPTCSGLSEILSNGRQLESFSLIMLVSCSPGAIFRQAASPGNPGLPFLRRLSISIPWVSSSYENKDLIPSVCGFIRAHPDLRTLRLLVHHDIESSAGYDAGAWGVLPSLTKLTALEITYTPDIPPAMASWFLPRGLRAVKFDHPGFVTREKEDSWISAIRSGLPPHITFIGLPYLMRIRGIGSLINSADSESSSGCKSIKVICQYNRNESIRMFTVHRKGSTCVLEQWPRRRVLFYRSEWLDSLALPEAQELEGGELY